MLQHASFGSEDALQYRAVEPETTIPVPESPDVSMGGLVKAKRLAAIGCRLAGEVFLR